MKAMEFTKGACGPQTKRSWKPGGLQTRLVQNTPYYAVGLLVAYGLKSYYSRATADQLLWILSPTALLVDLVAGISFEAEHHAGFICREYGIILAPACSGVNFMIIAFLLLCFSFVHRLNGGRAKLLWLLFSAVSAYLLTLGVNGLRIIISVYLHRADLYGSRLTPEALHRLEGSSIYFIFLVLLHRIGGRLVKGLDGPLSTGVSGPALENRGAFPVVRAVISPCFWYALVTIGVPLLNQGWRVPGAKFLEHCMMVAAVCSTVGLILVASSPAWRGHARLATQRWIARYRPRRKGGPGA